jgi:O-antigen ligase
MSSLIRTSPRELPPAVRVWAWRLGLLAFVVISAARSKLNLEGNLPTVLMAVQFAFVVPSILAAFLTRGGALRLVDKILIASLAVFSLLQLATWPISADSSESLSQAAILALMVVFLVATYRFRWSDGGLIQADLRYIFVLVCSLQGVGLVGFLVGADWATAGYGRFVGTFTNANFAGMMSAFVLPLVVYLWSTQKGRWRVVLLAGALVLLCTLVLSLSRGAFAAALAGLVIAVIFLVRRLWFTVTVIMVAALAGGGLLVLLYALRNTVVDVTLDPAAADPTSGRGGIAEILLGEWVKSPVLGIGYRASTTATNGLEAHNIYLTVLVETGIVGAVVFLIVGVSAIVAGPHLGRSAIAIGGLVAVAVSETTESSLFGWGAPSAVIAWLVVLSYAALGRSSYIGMPDSLDAVQPAGERSL